MLTTAKKTPAKSRKAKKQLTERQWRNLRKRYENDKGISLYQLSKETGISSTSIKNRAKSEGWAKQEDALNNTKVLNLNGSPTKYRPEYCQKIIDYFKNHEPYRELVDPNNPSIVRLVPNKPKTLAGFAAECGVHRGTLWVWANERDSDGQLIKPDFHDALMQAMAYCENNFLQASLCGVYNATITGLVLKNHFYYQPLVPPPRENNSDRVNTDELDQIYENALKEAAERQKAIEGRFERLVGSGTTDSSYQTESPGNGFDDD